MSHDISTFVAEIAGVNGFMRPSQFELSIPGMPEWSNGTEHDGKSVRFFCNQASLPGVNIDSIDNRVFGSGLLEYFPTGASFFDLQTSFYADQNSSIVRFFQDWSWNTVNWLDDDPEKFRIRYRDYFVSQVLVTQFDTEGNRILEYTYVDAFPVNIQPVGLRWNSRDEVMEFEVIWKYRTWRRSNVGQRSGSTNLKLGTLLPGSGLSGFTTTVARGVNGVIGRMNEVQDVIGRVQNVGAQVNRTVSSVKNTGSLLKSKFKGLL
jgi:hypothetical protein